MASAISIVCVMIYVAISVCLCLNSSILVAGLLIESPLSVVFGEPGENTTDVVCEILTEVDEFSSVCLTVIDMVSNAILMDRTCMNSDMVRYFHLQNVRVGAAYMLKAEGLFGHSKISTYEHRQFMVYKHEQVIPSAVLVSPQTAYPIRGDNEVYGAYYEASSNSVVFIADANTDTSTATIYYQVSIEFPAFGTGSGKIAPLRSDSSYQKVFDKLLMKYKVCLIVANVAMNIPTEWCYPMTVSKNNDRYVGQLQVENIGTGQFSVSLYLQQANYPFQKYKHPNLLDADMPNMSQSSSLVLSVRSIYCMHGTCRGQIGSSDTPSIVRSEDNIREFSFSPNAEGRPGADVYFNFRITGHQQAIIQVVPCLTVFRVHRESFNTDQHRSMSGHENKAEEGLGSIIEIVSFMCLTAGQRSVQLTSIPTGRYSVKMQLALANNHSIILSVPDSSTYRIEARNEFNFRVHHLVELVPSYEWQPLHVWHSVPSGIVTR